MPRTKKQHLKRRKDGRFACRYHNEWFYGTTEDEALQARENFKRIEHERLSSPMTVREYAEQWLPIAKASASYSTMRTNRRHMANLIDCIGDEYLEDVRPLMIKQIFTSKYSDKSKSYTDAAKYLFNAFFDSAVSDRYCLTNPAREKSAKPHKGTSTKRRSITQQERDWIHRYCQDHPLYPFVMTMLYAGLRPQEAKALNVDRDVDFDSGTVTVSHTVHLKTASEYTITDKLKTDYSARTIPLLDPLHTVLKDLHGYLIHDLTVSKYRSLWSGYVRQMERSINGCDKLTFNRMKKADPSKRWISFDIVPYNLRHAFISMCRDADVDIHTCIEWMGHADAKMILSIYDEVSSERAKKQVEKLEKTLLSSQNGSQTDNK